MCQGSPGEGGWLRQLLQDPFQVLGDFGKGSASARFHLMGKDRGSFSQCSKSGSLSSLSITWDRTALSAGGWGRRAGRARLLHCSNGWPGAGKAVGSHPLPGSEKQPHPGQSPVGIERKGLQVSFPWVLLLPPVRTSSSREPFLVVSCPAWSSSFSNLETSFTSVRGR